MRQQGSPLMTRNNGKDLVFLKDLVEAGRVTPVIDRSYPLDRAPEALGYAGKGHARGKIVITMPAAPAESFVNREIG